MTLLKSISGIRGTIGGESGNSLTPLDIVKAVQLGVDMFDCVIPTRHARNG